jgi:hypothetical protein
MAAAALAHTMQTSTSAAVSALAGIVILAAEAPNPDLSETGYAIDPFSDILPTL